jgi:hypothetical protein
MRALAGPKVQDHNAAAVVLQAVQSPRQIRQGEFRGGITHLHARDYIVRLENAAGGNALPIRAEKLFQDRMIE